VTRSSTGTASRLATPCSGCRAAASHTNGYSRCGTSWPSVRSVGCRPARHHGPIADLCWSPHRSYLPAIASCAARGDPRSRPHHRGRAARNVPRITPRRDGGPHSNETWEVPALFTAWRRWAGSARRRCGGPSTWGSAWSCRARRRGLRGRRLRPPGSRSSPSVRSSTPTDGHQVVSNERGGSGRVLVSGRGSNLGLSARRGVPGLSRSHWS